MKRFRDAFLLEDNSGQDWTRAHGYTKISRFSFPDLYLSSGVEALLAAHEDLAPLLDGCLKKFVNHDYGGISSLDQVDNFNQREMQGLSTWMGALWPTPYGALSFQIFYDMGLFYLAQESQRERMLRQRAREQAAQTS